jgi:hypothetical protein
MWDSNTVTSTPWRASIAAVVKPPTPAPIITTFAFLLFFTAIAFHWPEITDSPKKLLLRMPQPNNIVNILHI